jgi:hypothetical protein
MLIERRNQPRRPVEIPAKLTTGEGSPLRDCVVTDISELGAKLWTDAAQDAPDDFTIAFAPRGPYRRCHVVWRTDGQMGVLFASDSPSHS